MKTIKQNQWFPGLEGVGGETKKQSSDDLKGSEGALYELITVGMHPYALVQTHRMYNTKREP